MPKCHCGGYGSDIYAEHAPKSKSTGSEKGLKHIQTFLGRSDDVFFDFENLENDELDDDDIEPEVKTAWRGGGPSPRPCELEEIGRQ